MGLLSTTKRHGLPVKWVKKIIATALLKLCLLNEKDQAISNRYPMRISIWSRTQSAVVELTLGLKNLLSSNPILDLEAFSETRQKPTPKTLGQHPKASKPCCMIVYQEYMH